MTRGMNPQPQGQESHALWTEPDRHPKSRLEQKIFEGNKMSFNKGLLNTYWERPYGRKPCKPYKNNTRMSKDEHQTHWEIEFRLCNTVINVYIPLDKEWDSRRSHRTFTFAFKFL